MNLILSKRQQTLVLVLLSMFFCSTTLIAQQDTIYYKSNWRPTTVKDSASFFRPPVKKEDDLYRIEDYYMSGQVQMSGLSESETKNLWDGKVTWYNEDGSILQQGTYNKNRLEGEWISFLGKKKLIAEYKNGFFIKGERNSGFSSNKIYAKKLGDTLIEIGYEENLEGIRYENYSTTAKGRYLSKYYGNNGQLIGERNLLDNGYVKGVEVSYYFGPMRVKEIRYYPFEQFLGATVYYPNGQVRTLFEQKPEYKKTYYKPDGTRLGVMNYRLNQTNLKPVSGTEYYFPYTYKAEEVGIIQSLRVYEDEKLLKQEEFYRDGKTKTIITYKKGFNKDLQISYDEKGTEIARATYEGYYPLNGTEISKDKRATFKDGELVEEINYYPKTEIVFCRKTQGKEVYYDSDGIILGTLETEYKNNYGKPLNGTRFYASYSDNKITSFEDYKDSKIIKRTSFRDRLMNDTLILTFKTEDFFDTDGYSKNKEINYYSNGAKQSEIEYEKYKKIIGTFYNNQGKLLGTYNYEKKDGILYEFFDDSDEIKVMQEDIDGKVVRLKRYNYGSNNRFGDIDPVLQEDIDVNCCAKFYTKEGDLFAEATFKEGLPWKGTIYDSKARTKFTLKDGKRNGTYGKYDFNQKNKLEDGQYSNDLREGVFSTYDYKGLLTKKETFKADKLNGESTFYNKEGEEIASIDYKDDLPINGTKIFNTGGVRTSFEETYADGVLIKKVSFDKNGGKRETKYENGVEAETTAYYKDSDKKRLTYAVKNNYLNGLVIRYDESGKEQNRAIFENNKLKSGTVFITSRDSDRRVTYMVLTKTDTKVSVTFKDTDDKVLFTAEEIVEEGYSQSYINKMNLDIYYLAPDRLY